MSVLLQESVLPYEAVAFDKIETTEYVDSLREAIKKAFKEIELIKAQESINFENTLVALSKATERVDHISLIFSNMDSADCTDEISSLSKEFYSEVTKFSNDLSLDEELFHRIKKIWDNKKNENLDPEQSALLEKSYLSMVRNGALLSSDDKKTIRSIDEELSLLTVSFSENHRKSINEYVLLVSDKSRLDGLPEGVLEAAKEKAKERGEDECFAFGLEFSSYYPLLQYCKDRELRKEIYMASSKIATEGEYSNQKIIKETIKLRDQRAKILGYSTHADFVLEQRMAKNPETVFNFIEDMFQKSIGKAKKEVETLRSLKNELTNDSDFQKWDYAFYAETLKKRELDLDDELLRPYFKLESVIEGVFKTASKLYELSFNERQDIPKYHEDVRVFEVTSADKFIGLFYCDFFPRKTKRAGAWMTEFRSQGTYSGNLKRPLVSIVCNFTKPTVTKPSLLTLNEVLTLFHEFGHALHGLLSDVKYRDLAGPNVFWDFVELPSQIFENWALEKDCLELFAKHYETGDILPNELVEKIKRTNTFLSGLATIRQLQFATLDMMYHTTKPSEINSITEFEIKVTERFELFPVIEGVNKSCSFGHIFAGGYSAGYYSYKWAEVLDADAFAYFKEKGIFNKEVAKSFKDNILSKGGSDHPMSLYKKFRGSEPSVDALLERSGL